MYWQQHPSTHLHQKPLPQSRRHHRSPRWREAPRRLVKHGGMNQQKWRCRQSYAGEILQWWFLLSWKIENNEAFTSKLSNFWNHHWGDCTNKSGFRKYWFSSVFFTVSKNQPNHNYHTKKPTKILKIHVIFHHTTIKLLGIQKWFQGISVDPHLVPRATYRRPKTPGVRSASSPTAGTWASRRWGQCHLQMATAVRLTVVVICCGQDNAINYPFGNGLYHLFKGDSIWDF